jgi:hypothetical protein
MEALFLFPGLALILIASFWFRKPGEGFPSLWNVQDRLSSTGVTLYALGFVIGLVGFLLRLFSVF